MGSLDAYYDRFYNGPPFKSGEEMQHEVLRLASFEQWPVWAVKRPGNLSENGFYYCGQSDTVKCFSCGGVISNWSAGDDVKTEHQKRYPDCLFVLGRANDVKFGAGNVVVKKEMAAASPGKDVFGSGAQQLNSLEDIQYSGFADRAMDTQPRMSSFKATSDTILDELHSLSAVVPQEHDRADGTTNTSARNPSRTPSQTLTEVDLNLVKYENYRLKTFEGRWSENSFMSPIDLAKAGFYYYGSGDNVQCAFCRGRLLNWKPTDTAMSEHQRHYPNCPFLQPGSNVGNVTAENEEYNKVQMPQNQQQEPKKVPSPSERLGIMMDKPKHPEYAIEASRLDTYKAWPKRSVIMPTELAKAGFFYIGYSDNVKCFFCDGGLRNWNHGDDPWREHTRWFSKCGFLKLNKSEEYIQDVLNEPNTTGGIETHNVAPTVHGPIEDIDQRELRARMDTAMVQHVLTMGFSKQVVKKVIEERLKSAGDDFPNFESLLQALFNENEDNLGQQGAEAEAKETVVKPSMSRRKRKNRKKKKKKGLMSSTSDERELMPPLGHEGGLDEEEDEYEEEDDEHNELNDPMLDPTTTTDNELRSLANQYSRIKEERTCKICMDADCSIVFLPCGHLVCCSSCAPALRTCPICRTFIKGSVRIFTT